MNQKRQRKIMQIITKSNFGGAQKYVYELSTELKKNEYDVVVAFGGDGILKEKLEKEGVRTISIKSLGRNINIFSDIKVFFELIKLIRKEKPDVIHLNSSKIGGVGALVGRILFVPKIIFTIHGFAFKENRGFISKLIIKKIYWITIFLSHHSIAVSESIKKQSSEILFSFLIKKKITVIKNEIKKIDFIERSESRKFIENKIKIDLTDKKIVGTIAELHHIKGINFLIKTAKDLIKFNPNLIFVVFGEGEERLNLEKQIAEESLENNFFLLGFVDQASKYLKALDLFVLTSLSEALALVILEAKQADLKIVASNVGGVPEAINDYKKAKLFESKNTNDLFNKIKESLSEEKFSEEISAENCFNLMFDKTIELYK